jgi:hypothetical protein
MAAQDEAAFEPQQEVLPNRLDAFEPPAVEPFRDSRRRCPRMRRLDLERLTDEQLEASGRPVECVAFGHASIVTKRGLHPTVAGAVAAMVWGALEPVDQRLFRCDYSDVAILGKAMTRGRGWRAAGFAIHAFNGAVFGLVYDTARRRTKVESRRLALAMALAEHVALYPLTYFVDRFHPARGEPGIPPLLTSARAFGQSTVRHAVFGILLGALTEVGSSESRARSRMRLRA